MEKLKSRPGIDLNNWKGIFYPPEEMIKKEFIKEVEEAEVEGELLSFEELQKNWKKESEL